MNGSHPSPSACHSAAASVSMLLLTATWSKEHEPEGSALRALPCVDRLEVTVRIERGHAAGAGGGDGLAVDMIGHVAGGKHPGDAGGGGITVESAPDGEVALAHRELAVEKCGIGRVADGHEETRDVKSMGLAAGQGA